MDSTAAAFLQESLRPPVPVMPTLVSPYTYLQQGFNTANQIDDETAAGQKLALSQEQLNLLPQSRKYNTGLQAADLQLRQAQADQASAHALYFGQKANQIGQPFVPPAFDMGSYPGDGGSSGTSDLPVQDGAPIQPITNPQKDDGDEDAPAGGSPYFNLGTGTAADPAPSASTITSKATGYYPTSDDDPNNKMEGGFLDAQGNRIATLDAFRRGEVDHVTAAVDKSSPLFGKTAYSPELGAPVKFTDTGSAFKGKGTSRVDIARDSAAGANSDENNGHLTFDLSSTAPAAGDAPSVSITPTEDVPTPGAPDMQDVPLVQVAGAENPAKAVVYQNGQQINGTVSGVRVPQSAGEADWLRQRANAYLTQLASAPGGNTAPARAYARAFDAEVQHAVAQFQRNRQFDATQAARSARSGSAAATQATDPTTGLPVVPGYFTTARKFTGGKISGDLQTQADIDNEQAEALDKKRDLLNKEISRNARGASMDDLLVDRGNYNDGTKKVTPGVRYFMQRTEVPDPDNPGAKKFALVQTPMDESQYLQYRQKMAALGVGDDPFKKAGATGSTPVLAPDASLSVLPSQAFGSTSLDDLPGTKQAVPTPVAAAAPAPVPAATDPTIRLKALQLATQQQKNAEAAAEAKKADDEAAAASRAQAADRAAAAQKVAENFDYSIFDGKPSTSRYLNVNDDPTGVARRAVFPKLDEAAKAAGVKEFDQKTALKLIQQKRDQAALDDLLKTVGDNPDVLNRANTLAAQTQARQGSLPTGFGQSSVGAYDRVIPNSGTH